MDLRGLDVEKTLIEHYNVRPRSNKLAGDYIIDSLDPTVNARFKGHWEAMEKCVMPLPLLDQEHLAMIELLGNITTLGGLSQFTLDYPLEIGQILQAKLNRIVLEL